MRPDDLASELRARRLRATPQRRAILGAFDGDDEEHLSAEQIHARASARVPGVSRGTVYAALAELTETGLLSSVGSQDPIRYETNVEPHDHFRCRLCLRIFDVDLRVPSTADLAGKGFEVEQIAVLAEGVCRDCGAFAQGLEHGTRAAYSEPQITADALATLSCVRHETVLGPLVVCASAGGIARIAFEGHADFDACAERAKSRRGGRAGRDHVCRCVDSIDAFLGGEHGQAEAHVDWTVVGDRHRAALESTQRIAWGEWRSYHDLDVDTFPYEIGLGFGTNPLPMLFPCHRVTQGQAKSEAYVGGADNRDALERLEHPK